MTSPRSKIFGGSVIAYSGGSHCLLKDGVVVFEGDKIVHVGPDYTGPVDRSINADGKLVIPGLISTHAHIDAGEGTRLLLDGGRREFMRNGFPNVVPTKGPGGRSLYQPSLREPSLRFGIAQLLRNGVTTALAFDLGFDKRLVDLAGDMGLRLYTGPWVSAGRYHFEPDGRLARTWDEKAAFAELERAKKFIADVSGTHNDRIRGIVTISEYYNATIPLLRAAREAATELGVGLTMHFCEQFIEFHETVRATGKTPVQILDENGILGPDVVLAHAVYLAGHSLTGYPYVDDRAILGRAGTSVAHSPAVFARRGFGLESFDRYARAGINMALGTDIFPMDLLEEMRTASLFCKITEGNHEAAPAQAVFNAATLGGAKALGRTDLGRLAAGAKADIVLVDMENLWIGPAFDPLRQLVTCGHGSMVDTVICDGRTLVEGKRLLVGDETEILSGAKSSTGAVWEQYPQWHWAGHTAQQDYPPSLPSWPG
jgi:5-methylthioadenosine/S-adenosylhomocysteine deaminase